MTVEGNQQMAGEQDLPPPGSCTPVSATAIRDASWLAVPKPDPTASTRCGRAAESAAMTSGSARGSPPRTLITSAPATRAVVTAALVAALFPAGTSSARWSSGAGALVAGSMAGLVTTRMPGSWAASTFAGTPIASTTCGSSA